MQGLGWGDFAPASSFLSSHDGFLFWRWFFDLKRDMLGWVHDLCLNHFLIFVRGPVCKAR